MAQAIATQPDPHPHQADVQARLTTCMNQVCNAVGAFIEYWGFKAIHGRIWCLLALKRTPMHQAAIARHLGVSRALVSGAMTELLQVGIVRQTSSGRTAPYEAVMDVWPSISDVLRSREWMLIETTKLALEAALEEADLARRAGIPIPYDTDRMKFILAMTEMAQGLLRMLIALRSPGSLDSLRSWAKRAGSLIQNFRRPW